MTAESERALATLGRVAHGHPGASSGERAAWQILKNFQDRSTLDFADCFTRLDGQEKRAVVQLLADMTTGTTGLIELG